MTIAFMTWVAPKWPLEQLLTAAIRYGYDGLEPRCGGGQEHGIELSTTKQQRKDIRAQFSDCSLLMPCLATSLRYALAEEAMTNQSIEETKKYLQLASDLGCPNLRVFGGVPPEGMSLDEAKQRLADSLSQCLDTADKCGVNLCLETHDAFSRAAEAGAVVKEVNHPRLGICWDLLHSVRHGESPEESWPYLQGHVYHCHIHDAVWPENNPDETTMTLMGEGKVPHAEAVRLLADSSFEGALSGEWIEAFPPEEILPQAAAELRTYLAQAQV